MKRIFCIPLILVLLLCSCQHTKTDNFLDGNMDEGSASNSAPSFIFLSLDELKEIKNAFDTMQADEFMRCVENEHVNAFITGMWDYESTTALMDELCSTTVLLLDGDKNNFSEIAFYWERNEVQQIVFFDENSRVSAYIYTPESSRGQDGAFGPNNEQAILQKELHCDNVSAYFYTTDSTDHLYADVFSDDTYIFMRTKDIKTIADFETCFNRLEFVKLGDLLNE